jgi:hypothetical protein
MPASSLAPAFRLWAMRYPTSALHGGLELGNRAGALKFVARFDHNSTELATLKAQTTGAVAKCNMDAIGL